MGMIRLKQFSSLLIEDLDENSFPLPFHSQNYNELVYIYSGKGTHLLNNNRHAYGEGDLLLISHDDIHHLEAEISTRIIAIKFTYDYFSDNNYCRFIGSSPFNLTNIINNKALKEIRLTFNQKEKVCLRQIINTILDSNQHNRNTSSSIIFYQILSIFGLIKEATSKILPRTNLPHKETIITYIHQHIFEPKKMRIQNIATHFNIAASYFSSYFKRSFDTSYRDYVNEYRLRLIDQRLESKQFSSKEIASEFGFNDESHFSHYYKNKKGIPPSAYIYDRKNQFNEK